MEHQTLSKKVVQQLWPQSTDREKDICIAYQRPAPAYVMAHWDTMSNDLRTHTCETKELPIKFIISKWDKMNDWMRDRICENQDLPMWFIRKHWHELTAGARVFILQHQEVATEFIFKRWGEFDDEEKIACYLNPNNVLDKLELEQLPTLLVDSIATIRQHARNLFERKRV